MEATTHAVEMIKRFEGLRLKAYLDPAGVPTIGYGTTVYPDGDKVRLGEVITANEATEFLAHDCARFARSVAHLVDGIALNQNQFDALVSFAYNEGIGAFRESSMLRKLTAKDFKGAAAEFPRWNKATVPVTVVVKGVKKTKKKKVVLNGLVKRRAAERALFETPAKAPVAANAVGGGAGAATFVGAPPDEPDPVTALLFDQGGITVVALIDASGAATDILQMPDQAASTMGTLLKQFPTLKTFTVAPAGQPVPAGEVQVFDAGPRPVPTVASAPTLQRPILERGSSDSAAFPGNDVKELQERLRDLGFYDGPVSGTFDSATHQAAVAFQREQFGAAEANGRVGSKTWAKLFPVGAPKVPLKPAPKPMPKTTKPVKGVHPPAKKSAPHGHASAGGKTYLYLTKTQARDVYGLRLLRLEYVRDGKKIDSIEVYSGVPGSQRFRKGRDSRMGSYEPLPEGRWYVHDILWKDGADNYRGKVWSKAQGAAKINLTYKAPGSTARQAIQIHVDGNRGRAPGTAGCLGIRNIADFKTLVAWLRDTDPRDLYVDYGLGTITRP